MHVISGPARSALAAGYVRVDDHGVPHRHVRHRRAHLVHPARVLVPGRVRQLDPRLVGPLTLLDVKVRPAETGGADPHDHVQRTVSSRLVYLVQLQRLLIRMQPCCLHPVTSSDSGARPWRNCSSDRQRPPFASRLVRTSRPMRSQRSNCWAMSRSPLASTNAGDPASLGIPNSRRSSTQRRASELAGSSATVLAQICSALAPSPLERAESLEQLRALQNGFKIHVLQTSKPHLGVDRPEDVLRVEQELAKHG